MLCMNCLFLVVVDITVCVSVVADDVVVDVVVVIVVVFCSHCHCSRRC